MGSSDEPVKDEKCREECERSRDSSNRESLIRSARVRFRSPPDHDRRIPRQRGSDVSFPFCETG